MNATQPRTRSAAVAIGALLLLATTAVSQSSAAPGPDGRQKATATAPALTPVRLRCEYLKDPLGVDTPSPRLSWELEASAKHRSEHQTAYQVLIASSLQQLARDQGDLWSSGVVKSDRQLGVSYAGKPLRSGQRVFWKVTVWDAAGMPRESDPARWEMALLSPADWKAQWISHPRPLPVTDREFFQDQPAPIFRREFALTKPVARARAYVTGLGYYELRLNGERVGDHLLDPGWTTYSKRVLYSTYDVGRHLKRGANAVGLVVGNGWYNPLPLPLFGRFRLREHLPVGKPRALLQLVVEYADGTRETIVTDESWKAGDSGTLRNSVFLGEVHDTRREPPGWDRTGFADREWPTAVRSTEPVGPLQAQFQPPIRATARLTPVKTTEVKPGVHIVDLGQNFAGRVLLRAGGPAGCRINLRYGELLYPDGTLNPMTAVMTQIKNSRVSTAMGGPPTAWQQDSLILSGRGLDGLEGHEDLRPRFTFHGLRYVEVTFEGPKPRHWRVVGERLNSDVESAGTFECSNELFNRIQKMVRWTQLNNMFSVQSDCPHREKLGYGGDIVAASEMAILNFDMSRFYTKAVRDFADARRPNGGITETAPYVGISDESIGGGAGPVGWGTAHPLLLWQLYQYYGDRRILSEQYDVAKGWLLLLEATAKDGILDNGISDHESLVPKPRALTGTAFYYFNADLMSRIAGVLGRKPDQARYAKLAQSIREAFNRRFLQPGTGRYDSATQACQAFALYMDLVPSAEREKALQVLADDVLKTRKGHLSTGIFGTKYMLDALTQQGRADVAFTVANARDFPGWGHMLEKGATTLWEHWEFSDNTYSHNHPMFGSVSEWFFKGLAGIQPDPRAEGFNRILIRPQPVGDLTWARATYQSVRGPIKSEWKKADGKLTLRVSIPPNTTATIYVPTADASRVTEGGVPAAKSPSVDALPASPGAAVFAVGSGEFEFVAPVR
jgi:alpha-L-rhamnosidase